MSCKLDRTLLQDYLDGEAGPLEKLLLEEHLQNCPHCRSEMEYLLMLYRCLEDPPQAPSTEGLDKMREAVINNFLSANSWAAEPQQKSDQVSGPNIQDIFTAIWSGQSVWANQTVNFIKYIPVESKAARKTSDIIKKSGRLAGRAMFTTAKKLAMAAASRRS